MSALTQHPVTQGTIDVRVRIAALWTATLFVFAYVDLFSLYRPDVRADLEAGQMSTFDVGQPFLFFTTLYVVLPSLMVYLSLVLPRRVNRPLNLTLASLYAVTVAGSAVGEWSYYVLGSVIEVALLAALALHAWSWRSPAEGGA